MQCLLLMTVEALLISKNNKTSCFYLGSPFSFCWLNTAILKRGNNNNSIAELSILGAIHFSNIVFFGLSVTLMVFPSFLFSSK